VVIDLQSTVNTLFAKRARLRPSRKLRLSILLNGLLLAISSDGQLASPFTLADRKGLWSLCRAPCVGLKSKQPSLQKTNSRRGVLSHSLNTRNIFGLRE
jgi:hypothetical protein